MTLPRSKSKGNWPHRLVNRKHRIVSNLSVSLAAPNDNHCTGISATLQAQHETFLSLANKTAALDAELQKIKTLYTQLWRAKTGSVRDPFNELDRTSDAGDYGMQSLVVK